MAVRSLSEIGCQEMRALSKGGLSSMATPLICCSLPECSIRTSSTRRQSDPGIRASVTPVMPRLRRATSRAIATWYISSAREGHNIPRGNSCLATQIGRGTGLPTHDPRGDTIP